NYYPYDENYYQLGTRYRDKLNLSNEDILLLNKVSCPNNNFFNIEFCGNEIVKLYLSAIKRLNEKCIRDASSLDNELNNIGDVIARKHYNYRKGSGNYKYSLETIVNELYSTIFKYCENTVRENYGHKRKLTAEITYSSIPEVAALYEEKVGKHLQEIIPTLVVALPQPDNATEQELNIQNTSRWKTKFEEITSNFKNKDGKLFVEAVKALGDQNLKNPGLENIYFEASKFIAKTDKEAALALYLYYIYYDLHSVTFNNKQLAKTIQKSLFKTEEQLSDFEAIVKDLIKTKDIDTAIKSVSGFYVPKRKKIQLNKDAIKEVQQQHSSTVELLNEVLREEENSIENNTKDLTEIVEEAEVSFQDLVSESKGAESFFVGGLALNDSQKELLRLFFENDYAVSKQEVEVYSMSNGLMRHQLIDSINDTCLDKLDDVLIEEEDEHYTIFESYFQKIIRND
ncbi:MAG: hypothetical protein EOP48_08445, partial [Sphingobacteriales bacterium]